MTGRTIMHRPSTGMRKALKQAAVVEKVESLQFVESGFGVATAKMEGGQIQFDPKGPKGGKPAPESDWMELNIPRKMSRAAIHRLVDKWIDGGRGRKP